MRPREAHKLALSDQRANGAQSLRCFAVALFGRCKPVSAAFTDAPDKPAAVADVLFGAECAFFYVVWHGLLSMCEYVEIGQQQRNAGADEQQPAGYVGQRFAVFAFCEDVAGHGLAFAKLALKS